ncbi:MAG: HPr family phosphocarrier protein [Bdellovibrionales bacterium]|nr:HPr family phosphocarrier protein [Bdellovibrionales bacterium]
MDTSRYKVKITNDAGLHTRSAVMTVKKASTFSSSIEFSANGMRVNAKSIMGLLALGASKGTSMEIETRGSDQVEAMKEMVKLIRNGFEESH